MRLNRYRRTPRPLPLTRCRARHVPHRSPAYSGGKIPDWTIQVCLDAVRKHHENNNFVKSLESLAQRLYAVTQLQEIELAGPEIMGVINAMSARYAKRLRFDPERIENAHIREIRSLLTQQNSRHKQV